MSLNEIAVPLKRNPLKAVVIISAKKKDVF